MTPTLPTIMEDKIQIISIDDSIKFDTKHINNDHSTSIKKKSIESNSTKEFLSTLYKSSLTTVPLFMKYFALHESIVLLCGAIYYIQRDIGVLCLSIIPGLCVLSIFIHFIRTQFDKTNNIIKSVFFSMKHYSVAFTIFIISLFSIIAIYHINTYLSYLIPSKKALIAQSPIHSMINELLQFPYQHSFKHSLQNNSNGNSNSNGNQRTFNYRITFVGSIIAPIIEESSKYLLLSLTFPIKFIWSFSKNIDSKNSTKHYLKYNIQSLFIMLIGLCGGAGIAIMENIGYLAACQWDKTENYCLPNRDFNILGAGLARGIFSVPFHCVTSIIMADMVCTWMNTQIFCLNIKYNILYIIKFILSYPISIILPIILHSGFNYWMKDIPFMTGIVTITGFAFISLRISKKYSIIKNNSKKINDEIEIEGGNNMIDLTITYDEPESLAVL